MGRSMYSPFEMITKELRWETANTVPGEDETFS